MPTLKKTLREFSEQLAEEETPQGIANMFSRMREHELFILSSLTRSPKGLKLVVSAIDLAIKPHRIRK